MSKMAYLEKVSISRAVTSSLNVKYFNFYQISITLLLLS